MEEGEEESDDVVEVAKRLEVEVNDLSIRLRELVPDGTGVSYRCKTCFRLGDEHPKGDVKFCKGGKSLTNDEYVESMTMQRDGLVRLIDRLVSDEFMEAELDKAWSELD